MPIWLIVLIVLFLVSLGGRESSQGVRDTQQAEQEAHGAQLQADGIVADCRRKNPGDSSRCDDMQRAREMEVTLR